MRATLKSFYVGVKEKMVELESPTGDNATAEEYGRPLLTLCLWCTSKKIGHGARVVRGIGCDSRRLKFLTNDAAQKLVTLPLSEVQLRHVCGPNGHLIPHKIDKDGYLTYELEGAWHRWAPWEKPDELYHMPLLPREVKDEKHTGVFDLR